MQLYKRLRREYEHGLGTISGVANKYKVHRRTVRAALKNAVPPKRKVTSRERPKMALAIPFIDAILNSDLKAQFKQRHTAHQIWERLQVEMPACDIRESTVRAYVRERRVDLGGQSSSQTAAAWMMEVLHSDAPLPVIARELPSGPASNLVGLIKGGRLRDRKKALSVLGSLRGIPAAVIARCLQMSRRTVARYSSCFAIGGIDALLPAKSAKPKDDPERNQLLFSLLHSPPGAHGIPTAQLLWSDEPGHFTELWLRNGHLHFRKSSVLNTYPYQDGWIQMAEGQDRTHQQRSRVPREGGSYQANPFWPERG